MNYKSITFEQDYVYVGLKYSNEETGEYGSIPEFWQYFTTQLFNSPLVNHLIDNNEAIGYREYLSSGEKAMNYYAACPIQNLDSPHTFHKILIPKGEYFLFKVNFKTKDEDIRHILDNQLPELEKTFTFNRSFDFEYYTKDYDYKDPNTFLYLAVQVLHG